MHPTPIFTNHSREQALAFTARYPFCVLAVNGEAGPVTALVPLVFVAPSQRFLGHVAKANPFWEAAKKAGKAAAIFRGPEAYISPSLYPSKAEHHKAVPTWNYMAVEVRGAIMVETDPSQMKNYLQPLTEAMERRRAAPWKISEAPEDYIAQLSRAIIGFSLAAENITFVEKLSQNKSSADRAGILAAFENSAHAGERGVAREMKRVS